MAQLDYINDFLNRQGVEGPRQLRGYIPARPGNFYGNANQRPDTYTVIGVSGVTIATGCDLGQTDAATLQSYGLPLAIVNQLRPYLGQKSAAAIAKLSALPLTIAADTAALLDECVHAGYLQRYVAPAYSKASGVSFDALPKQAQAVVFSVCYQKGCGGVRRDWPKLWGYLVAQDWCAASKELLTGFSQYKLRRKIEGDLLQELC